MENFKINSYDERVDILDELKEISYLSWKEEGSYFVKEVLRIQKQKEEEYQTELVRLEILYNKFQPGYCYKREHEPNSLYKVIHKWKGLSNKFHVKFEKFVHSKYINDSNNIELNFEVGYHSDFIRVFDKEYLETIEEWKKESEIAFESDTYKDIVFDNLAGNLTTEIKDKLLNLISVISNSVPKQINLSNSANGKNIRVDWYPDLKEGYTNNKQKLLNEIKNEFDAFDLTYTSSDKFLYKNITFVIKMN